MTQPLHWLDDTVPVLSNSWCCNWQRTVSIEGTLSGSARSRESNFAERSVKGSALLEMNSGSWGSSSIQIIAPELLGLAVWVPFCHFCNRYILILQHLVLRGSCCPLVGRAAVVSRVLQRLLASGQRSKLRH